MEEFKQAAEPTTTIQLVNPLSREVDAGKDLSLQVRVTNASGSDLVGCKIRILDSLSHVVTETELALFDGASNDTFEFLVKAPDIPDEYTWTVVFPAQQREGILFEESTVQFSFVVKPHIISLSVWGVPFPVSQGEKFKINIGAKCSAGCSLASLPIAIKDENHLQLAIGQLGEEVLPETHGIYWTEQEIDSPRDETLHKWVVQGDIQGLELEHQINSETFLFRTAKSPEHIVTIKVSDKYSNTPIEGAYVMVGLYKATADENGIARLKVPGGNQELYVTKDDFLVFQETIEITEEANILVDLEYSPVL